MNELPVFISYRQVDGSDLALWLHKSLYGKTRALRGPALYVPVIVSPYLDLAAPGVDDWRDLHERELRRARALLVVCTPRTMDQLSGDQDWFYYELRWWLKERPDTAPVLVTSIHDGLRYIPELIRLQWPAIQVVRVDPRVYRLQESSDLTPALRASRDASIQAILGGIAHSAGDGFIGQQPAPWHSVGMYNLPSLYTWEKDRSFRYINANENYARAAGFDSPHALLGRTDDDMPWSSLADFFRAGDYEVMCGAESQRLCVPEKEIMVDRVADILVSEGALRDRRGEVVGLTGCFLDVTGRDLIPRDAAAVSDDGSARLGDQFDYERLSAYEVAVFRALVRGLVSPARIANALKITETEASEHLRSLKRKLQCSTVGDLVATAVRAGLPLELFGPMVTT